jgi:hypothetical protein
MEKWSSFSVDFDHFDGFGRAVSGTKAAADAKGNVVDLFATETFGHLSFHEGILASGWLHENVCKYFL